MRLRPLSFRQVRTVAVAAIALLVVAAEVAAQPVWLTGFETGIGQLDCTTSFVSSSCGLPGTCTVFETSDVKSGTYALSVKHGTGATEGICSMVTGLGETGTFIVTGWVQVRSATGGATCSADVADAASLEIRNSSASTIAAVTFKCTNGNSDFQFGISGGSVIGSRVNATANVWAQFEILIKTGSGTGEIGGRFDGTSIGSNATGLTIANLDALSISHPVATGASNQAIVFDDIVVLRQATYPGPTYVNMRKPDGAGSGRDNWRKENGGSITGEWTMPQAVTLPSSGSKTTYACAATSGCSNSVTSDGDGQSATLANWDTGTPLPVVDAGTMTAIHGCRSDYWAERGGGTARTYGIYNAQGGTKNTPLAVTLTNGTLELFRQFFAISPATLSNLNTMEVGAEKTSDTSGASMTVEDVWTQCAWSTTAATATLFGWGQSR